MMSEQLFVYEVENLDLSAALHAYLEAVTCSTPPVAICYGVQKCWVAQVQSGPRLMLPTGELPLSSVYEVRAFCQAAELRWRNDPTFRQRHATVVLSEAALGGNNSLGEPERLTVLERHPRQYLLWGKQVAGEKQGWSKLSAARIGAIEVPVATESERLALHSVEYLMDGGEYAKALEGGGTGGDTADGNVVAGFERLSHIGNHVSENQ